MTLSGFDSYKDYIFSPYWQNKRDGWIILLGATCQKCGKVKAEYESKYKIVFDKTDKVMKETWVGYEMINNNGLTIHHLNYDSLGNERQEDIMVVCKKCHAKLHQEKTNI